MISYWGFNLHFYNLSNKARDTSFPRSPYLHIYVEGTAMETLCEIFHFILTIHSHYGNKEGTTVFSHVTET